MSRAILGSVMLSSMLLAPLTTPAIAEAALGGLVGTWSGSGQIKLSDGRSERLSCRAFYNPRDGGAGMGIAIRCASQSYKIELRSSLALAGGRVTGTWEERSFNAGGSISGSAAPGSLDMAFSGSTTGAMSISYSGSTQRVSITSSGTELSGVVLSLLKN